MLSLADYRQDSMPHNHMKFFESVQSFGMRPSNSSLSHSAVFGNGSHHQHPSIFASHDGYDFDCGRPRSGSSGSFFKDDMLESTVNNDDFPPISTFHVASPSPRKQQSGSYGNQQPPRANRFRRNGQTFRNPRNDNGSSSNSQQRERSSKQRHDSYSSNEGNFCQMTLQQQQAINNEAANGQNNADFVGRYKTELCRPFMENGECKYGEKCQFAHGRHELKQMSRHPKYKTEYCRTFHTVGFCPYGPRCHFLHLLDLDNPATLPEDSSTGSITQSSPHSSSSDEHIEKSSAVLKIPSQLAISTSCRGDSASPEPSESVFTSSPSPPAVSPISSAVSVCSTTDAQSSGIGLSSPNASVSSTTSPSASLSSSSNAMSSIELCNESEFPPLPQNQPPIGRSHQLLTISTQQQQQEIAPNFAQLQQQKRQAAAAAFIHRQISPLPALQSPQKLSLAGRRLPIFSNLATN